MKTKEFKTVEEMVCGTVRDNDLREDIIRRLEQRSIVNHLIALRGSRGLSQGDVAKLLDCSQSRVSKLEQTMDDDIRLGDIARYANAVGYSLHIGMVQRESKLVDIVKYHVFSIREALKRLVELAHSDSQIAKGVAGFFGEAFYNVIKIMQESSQAMPVDKKLEPLMHVDVISDHAEMASLRNTDCKDAALV